MSVERKTPLALFATKKLELTPMGNTLVFSPDVGSIGFSLAIKYPERQFWLLFDNPNQEVLLKQSIIADPNLANVHVVNHADSKKLKLNLICYVPQSHIGFKAIAADVQSMKELLNETGELVLLTRKKLGGQRHGEILARAFGVKQIIEEKKGLGGCMLFRARKVKGMGLDYRKELTGISVSALGETIKVQTFGGLFSKDGLDKGTEFLLTSVLADIKRAQSILDVGCGWGAIGLIVAKINPLAKVSMIDVGRRSIEIATKNTESLGLSDRVNVTLTAHPSELIGKYDLVLSNPPFHEKTSILIDLFSQTKSILAKEGKIYIVVENTYRYKFETILKKVFGGVEKFTQNTNYLVLVAKK